MQKISIKKEPKKTRNIWSISPVTRVKHSKKIYNRKVMKKLLNGHNTSI